MLNAFKMIKEGLKDPKKSAITKLALYAVFFVIVFIVLSNAENKESYTIKDNSVNYYDYKYEINFNNKITNVFGVVSDESYFIYNNNKYILKDSNIYLNDVIVESPLEFDVKDFYYDSIKELINKGEFISKTTYNDSREETTYNIKVSDYFKDSDYECINNCDNTIVIKVEKKDYINKVIIDLTSVNNINYIISIEYTKK